MIATNKWCEHCKKTDHNDSECWSTRYVPGELKKQPFVHFRTNRTRLSYWIRVALGIEE